MPLAMLAALLGSLLIHGLVLFGAQLDWLPETGDRLLPHLSQSQPLRAELRAPPLPEPKPAAPPARKIRQPRPEPVVKPEVKPEPAPRQIDVLPDTLPEAKAEPVAPLDEIIVPSEPVENAPVLRSTAEEAAKSVAMESETFATSQRIAPVHSGSGQINFVVIKDSLGMQIGRAVHRWHFAEDGSYVLNNRMETSGLVSLLKPLRQEYESRGRLGANGLQPESFRVLRNGRDSRENADFDWSTAEVQLARDASRQRIAPGTQDLLSLNYQLAYLPNPENGSTLGVVTGRKYERYNLDSLGEVEIETPAGRFRALHLRAAGETLTEIWIALDHQRLPVKIRFTDKKGDSYTQLATDLDLARELRSLKPSSSGNP